MSDLIEKMEAAMMGDFNERLYGGGSSYQLTSEQVARRAGYYWVRDRGQDPLYPSLLNRWLEWRISYWDPKLGWFDIGTDAYDWGEPGEVGPEIPPPA